MKEGTALKKKLFALNHISRKKEEILKVLAYEFYFHDPLKGIQFAGIFPERRKDPKRVNRDDIKKLGESLTGKRLDSKKLSFN